MFLKFIHSLNIDVSDGGGIVINAGDSQIYEILSWFHKKKTRLEGKTGERQSKLQMKRQIMDNQQILKTQSKNHEAAS